MTLPAVPPGRLILYDGVCAFCNRAVRWVLAADHAAQFRFAPLQGRTAQTILARHPELPADLDSILYVRPSPAGEIVLWRAAAVFAICRDLGGVWRGVAWLRWLPQPLQELAYRSFAANRYRWFGKYDTCPLPSESERDRFLD